MEDNNFTIDIEEVNDVAETTKAPVVKTAPKRGKVQVASRQTNTDNLVSCLSDTKVVVQHIPQPGTISDPKHVLYGGMAERSVITITVPRLKSGTFKNVLTNSEKDFLEAAMGLEPGAMNVYNKVNNFWDNTTEGGISKVRLTKFDTTLDLSDPVDYIRYKILLANKDLIAPSMQELQDHPKATYKFVLITDNATNAMATAKMTNKMQAFVELGTIKNNFDLLRGVVETLSGKPVAKNTNIEFLYTTAAELADADAKMFLRVVQDPLLGARVLIKNCVENSLISKRGDYYYLRSDNSPLCESGEEPTLSVAAAYISNPKRQELKLSLETLLKQK